jgi:hypothetical protein
VSNARLDLPLPDRPETTTSPEAPPASAEHLIAEGKVEHVSLDKVDLDDETFRFAELGARDTVDLVLEVATEKVVVRFRHGFLTPSRRPPRSPRPARA